MREALAKQFVLGVCGYIPFLGLVLGTNFHVNIFSVAPKLSELELQTWNLCETEKDLSR